MKVSIVIPCFNLGQYLEDALESIYSQSYRNYEAIVVDDGSTDEQTINKLKELSRTYPELRLYHKKNSGLAGARNYGIERANGEYVVCLDADDALHPDYLEKTVAILEADEEKKLGFVTTWLQEFGERDHLWQTSNFNIPKLLVGNVAHVGSMFRKAAWAKVDGYKKMKIGGYEDWEFWLSIVEKGYEWKIVKEPLFFYRIRKNSMLSVAKSAHVEIYQMLFEFHEELFAKYSKEVVIENAKEVKSLHERIAGLDKEIGEFEKYLEEVINLRTQVFHLRDEINAMRNSRVLGRLIKLRDRVGRIRHKLMALPHATRVVLAPIIPKPARRAAKKIYRRIRYPNQNPPTEVKITNQKWDKNLPLVSVVVPYYNRADTIDETLDSLTSQTFKDFETILVNDGSTDPESIEKLEELKKAGMKLRFIQQANLGVAVARNNGINQAKGKYVICLDSDDALKPTFMEKATIVLETAPDISLVTAHIETFGVLTEPYIHIPYDPLQIKSNNMVITAAEFKKKAWEVSGGYKSGIGYEDWEFWVNLAERGFWGKLIPEQLFRYRTSMQSRYVGDKDMHWKNTSSIRELHPSYIKNVKKLLSSRRGAKNIIDPKTAFLNLDKELDYQIKKKGKKNVLVILPWMTFGGAETLILNFCHEIKDKYNLSIVTGLDSEHEWENKFKEITQDIYHLANLFEDEALYLEFISNYIKTRNIDAIHIIHTNFAFGMLGELKRRHPGLKVALTLFNDRAAHFKMSLAVKDHIDIFTSDNESVRKHYREELGDKADIQVIPNGINSYDIFNPLLFDRARERQALGIEDKELAAFFIGRLSEEKNPDVFLDAAQKVIAKHNNVRFFVIGDGIMAKGIKKAVADINNPNVQYLGYQSDVAKYLSAADVFILPSSIEGFPLSILEAMAMRVAVVASDVGAVAEIIESGIDGFVVSPGSAQEIVDTILNLTNNPKLLAEIKGKARQKVENKYSNIILGRNYKKLYEELTK